jgi:hypothetical protein
VRGLLARSTPTLSIAATVTRQVIEKPTGLALEWL